MDSAKESQVDQVLMILEPIFHSHDERDKQSWKPALGRSKKLHLFAMFLIIFVEAGKVGVKFS
jgi:hypothetical protein